MLSRYSWFGFRHALSERLARLHIKMELFLLTAPRLFRSQRTACLRLVRLRDLTASTWLFGKRRNLDPSSFFVGGSGSQLSLRSCLKCMKVELGEISWFVPFLKEHNTQGLLLVTGFFLTLSGNGVTYSKTLIA